MVRARKLSFYGTTDGWMREREEKNWPGFHVKALLESSEMRWRAQSTKAFRFTPQSNKIVNPLTVNYLPIFIGRYDPVKQT